MPRRSVVVTSTSRYLAAAFGASDCASFWKRGSFRSGSNMGSSRRSAGVSGAPQVPTRWYREQFFLKRRWRGQALPSAPLPGRPSRWDSRRWPVPTEPTRWLLTEALLVSARWPIKVLRRFNPPERSLRSVFGKVDLNFLRVKRDFSIEHRFNYCPYENPGRLRSSNRQP